MFLPVKNFTFATKGGGYFLHLALLLCIALATNLVGSKSQAQTHTFHAGFLTGTTITPQVKGQTQRRSVIIAFSEEVILTVTNEHPSVVDLRYRSRVGTPVNMTITTLDRPPDFQSGSFDFYADADSDDIVDADENYEIVFAWRRPGSTSNTASVTLTGTVIDDDSASADYTLNPASTLASITEGGSTTFTAVLDAQPASDVVLTLTHPTQVSLGLTSLTFTTSDWNTVQTVSVSGVNNDIIGNLDYTITVAVDSGPGGYGTLANKELTGTVTDNDAASADFTLSPTSTLTSITEGGSTTFTAVLAAQPVSDVVLTLTHPTQVSLDLSSLTFTTSNWNAVQTVSVSGVNNALIDGSRNYTITVAVSSGPGGYGTGTLANKELTGTITDDDAANANFTLNPTPTLANITEGESTTFTAVLAAQPASDVVLTLTHPTQVSLDLSSFTFTTSNWNAVQTVNVAGVNNAIIGDQDYTITVAVDSGPGGYGTLANKELTGIVTDDDAASADFTLSPTQTLVSITEGGSTTFTAVLAAQPVSDVVLTLTHPTQVSLDLSSLTFTTSNWNAVQTVSVSGVDNAIIGDQDYTITVAVSSGPGGYGPGMLANKELTGTVTDDDAANAGFTLSPTSALTSITEGGSTTFTAVLAAQPVSDVVLTLTHPTQVSLDLSSLTFTTSNWNAVQTVSVSGVDNAIIGDQDYIITVAVSSGPGGYGTLANKELTGTVTDDGDTAGITFSTGTTLPALSRDETITFTTVLTAQPNSNVVLTLTSSTTVVATVGPALLTFTNSDSNWNTAQTITITAEENAAEEITSYTITVAVVDASSDDNFDRVSETLVGEVSYGITEAGEVQSKSAVAVADTFGAAQIATDLISARIQQPPSGTGLQARLAGNQLLGLDIPARPSLKVSHDPWDWNPEDQTSWSNDFASLISGTDFVLPLSASADGTSQAELWAAIGHTNLKGDPTIDNVKVDYDGEATGIHVGIGRQQQTGLNYGLAVGSTKVELDLTGDDVTKIERDLLSFHPYIGWSLAEGTNAWLIAGIGDGDYDLELANGTQENTEASMLMLGGGLQRAWEVNSYEFAARLEGMNTRSEIEDTDTLAGSKGSAWQLRAELEVGRSYRPETGGQVQPYATFGYRRDGGDIGSSGAGEFGLGLRSQLNNAWSIDVKSRFQVTDAEHERRSYQGYLKYDHGFDQRGLLFSVSHSYDYEIKQEDDLSSLTNEYEGRIGYGWGRTLFQQRGIVGIHLKSSSGNDNSGLVLGLGFEAPSLQLGLDGSNDEVKVHLNYINIEY